MGMEVLRKHYSIAILKHLLVSKSCNALVSIRCIAFETQYISWIEFRPYVKN